MRDTNNGIQRIHVLDKLSATNAAATLVHEATHVAHGDDEVEAYAREQEFLLELLKKDPNNREVKELLRDEWLDVTETGELVVDRAAIAKWVKSKDSGYPAWAGDDPLVRYKPKKPGDPDSGQAVRYGNEKRVHFEKQ